MDKTIEFLLVINLAFTIRISDICNNITIILDNTINDSVKLKMIDYLYHLDKSQVNIKKY